MEQNYSDMNALLKADARAWKYFNMLPDHIRANISANPAEVHTFDALQSHAQRLMGSGV